jgi:tetratricopeptide (TPR) repeat protein
VEILRAAELLASQGDARARAVRLAIQNASRRADPAFTLGAAGRALGEIGEWSLAAWAFEEALRLDPQTADARAYLGLALDQSGGDGLEQLLRAVEEAPESPLPHFFLGLHWRARGDAEQALEALTSAAELDPESPAIAAELAGALEDLGEMDEALAAFLHAANLAPDESGFWRLLADFSTRNEIQVTEVGLPAARNALALAPDDPAACDALAFAYFLAGDDALARRFIDRAVRLHPLRSSTQYHLGLLLLSQGEIPAARSALEWAALLDPDGPVGALARRTLERLPPS